MLECQIYPASKRRRHHRRSRQVTDSKAQPREDISIALASEFPSRERLQVHPREAPGEPRCAELPLELWGADSGACTLPSPRFAASVLLRRAAGLRKSAP